VLKTMKSMLEVTGAPEEVLLGPSDATNETRVTLCFGSLRVLTALGDLAIDPMSLRNRCMILKAHLNSQGHWVSHEDVILLGESAQQGSAAHNVSPAPHGHGATPPHKAHEVHEVHEAPHETPHAPGASPLGVPAGRGQAPASSRPPIARPANASPFAVLSAAARSGAPGAAGPSAPARASSPFGRAPVAPAAASEAAPRGPTAVRPTSPGAPGFGLQRSPSGGSGPAPAPARPAQPGRPAYAASSSPSPSRKPFDPSASVDDLDDVPF
jgi:hypothetical protein